MRYHGLNFKYLAIVISAVLFLSAIAYGQKKSRPKPKTASATATGPVKRPVNITLKRGDEISGNFLRADTETMEVETKSGNLTIRMSEVSSLYFIGEDEKLAEYEKPAEEEQSVTAPPSKSRGDLEEPGLQAERKAYAALRKLDEAAKIKLPAGQYGDLLIDAKTTIDEALMDISDYSLKNAITRTLEAYYDAGQALGAAQSYEPRRTPLTWGSARVVVEQRISVKSEPGATLMRKYQIKPEVDRLAQADHLKLDEALNAIWAVASARLNYVATFIRQ
jgi:hypothetical protein